MKSQELVELFWGKAGPVEKGRSELHPALFHMLDVGMVARAMVERSPGTALRGLRGFAGLNRDEAARRMGFLIALHDLGKISPGFQDKRRDLTAEQRGRGYQFPEVMETDHGQVTLQHLRQRSDGAAETLARAIAAHHGTFHARGAPARRRKDGTEGWLEAREAAVSTLGQLFGVDVEAALGTERLSAADAMVLAGLTSVADWIGSDKKLFPPTGPTPWPADAYAEEAYHRARRALELIGWDAWQPDGAVWEFGRLYPSLPPNTLQRLTERLAMELSGPAVVIIEAPMGMGKTEAGLHLADVLMNRFGHAGLYDALPTQATSSQIFRRVRHDYLERRLSGMGAAGTANLHLLHGLAAFDDAYAELWRSGPPTGPEPSEIDDPDARPGERRPGVTAAAWFRGRKLGLLSPFAVGTVDQALMGVLQSRHMFVRLHGLANKVVLVDEAHAYDTYTSTLLDCLVEWLGALGCSVIILSATLPAERRRALLRAYCGREIAAAEFGYPRITAAVRKGEVSGHPVSGAPERMVHLECLSAPAEGGGEVIVADRLAGELREGGCAGWICNTVDAAQRAYLHLRRLKEQGHAVFGDAELVLYHARFPAQQRQRIEAAIDRKFGKAGLKTGERPRRAVLIGTQVLEQALDYSVDAMVTELAPVDLVLQRSGRLHRHAHWRPVPLEEPRLLWLAPAFNADGEPQFGVSGCIYEKEVLLRSWHAVSQREAVELPHGIEEMVEEVYGEPRRVLPEPLQQLADRLKHEAEIAQAKHQSLALTNAIGAPAAEDPFQADRVLPDEEAPSDMQGTPAVTRLAEPSISLICARRRGREIVLSMDDARPLNLEVRPDRDEEARLLRHSARLQSRGWVEHFRREPVPKGWRESPALQHYRLAVFEEGALIAGSMVLSLDSEVGLVTAGDVARSLADE